MPKRSVCKIPALEWSEECIETEEQSTNEHSSSNSSEFSTEVPNLSNHLPTFNDFVQGAIFCRNLTQKTKSHDVSKWIKKVEEIKVIYNWSELTTIYNMTTRLRGLAKTWYQSLPSVNFSWIQWKEKLLKAFPVKTDYYQQLEEMLKRKKQSNESTLQYYYEKLALCNICEIAGEKAVSCIIGGLCDENVQTSAKVGEFKEPDDLLRFLKNVSSGSSPNNTQDKHKRKEGLHRLGAVIKSDRTTVLNKRKCYGCGSRDHLLPSCPERIKRRCERCKRIHTGDCKKEQPRQILSIREEKNPGNKYFMEAYINNKVVRVFVDLGSTCNIMKEKVVKELGLGFNHNTKIIKGYGGGILKTLGETELVNVKIDLAEAETTFLIVTDNVQNIPAIIGQSFTEQPHITVHKSKDILRIYQNNWNILPNVIDLPPLKIPVWAKNSTIIPPKEGANIVCCTNYEGDMCVEVSIRTEENNEYCIPRCIVKATDGEVVVPAINPTNREVFINSKEIFVRGEACLEKESVLNISDINEDFDIREISVGAEIDQKQREKLESLLEKFQHCFGSTVKNIGKTDIMEMKLTLQDEKPIIYKPYRMSPNERAKVKEIVSELLKCGIIRESSSPTHLLFYW